MANSAGFGVVSKITGVVYVRIGGQEPIQLKEGDLLMPGQTLILTDGSRIDFDNGLDFEGPAETLLSGDMLGNFAANTEEAAVSDITVDSVLALLEEGGDLLDSIEAPAAGLGGDDGAQGHSFIRLARIAEGTDTPEFVGDAPSPDGAAAVTEDDANENIAPIAVDDAIEVEEDSSTVIQVINNDIDADGDSLTVTGTTDPTNGSVVINGDGTITYTPDENFNGIDTFDYTVDDGNGGSDTASVTVTVNPVNDSPFAADDDQAVTDEDSPVVINVLANDGDIDGDSLTITGTTEPANGSVVINPDGTVTYTPNENFNGTDSFEYTVDDGNGGSDTASVTVTVNPINDAPFAADDDQAVTDEDSPVVINVLANDSDIDNDSLTVTNTTEPANGSVAINPDGTVTYTPDENFNGTDTFDYTVDDGNGGSDTASVTVTVNPLNDGPIATDNSYATDEDNSVSGNVISNDTGSGVDSDEDVGDSFVVTDNSTPTNGSVSIAADGTFTYTPNADFNGSDSFTYTITDNSGASDTATVNINVTPVDDAPDAVDNNHTVAEDGTLTVAAPGILGNDDIGGDGGTLAATLATDVSNGSLTLNSDGSFSYTPDENFNGSDSFTYTIADADGDTDTATVNINVTPVDDTPDAVDNSHTVAEDGTLTVAAPGILSNDDIGGDGGTLAATLATDVSNGNLTLNNDGSFTYVPDADFNGSDSFTYTIADADGDTDTATVNITVTAGNDVPDAVDNSHTVAEDGTLTVAAPGILGNDDIGGDGGTLAATLATDVS
ncbi:MAG: retention module-containing protein, partial [Spongiibacteraceae bacterium]